MVPSMNKTKDDTPIDLNSRRSRMEALITECRTTAARLRARGNKPAAQTQPIELNSYRDTRDAACAAMRHHAEVCRRFVEEIDSMELLTIPGVTFGELKRQGLTITQARARRKT
jgi:hypothetical protein